MRPLRMWVRRKLIQISWRVNPQLSIFFNPAAHTLYHIGRWRQMMIMFNTLLTSRCRWPRTHLCDAAAGGQNCELNERNTLLKYCRYTYISTKTKTKQQTWRNMRLTWLFSLDLRVLSATAAIVKVGTHDNMFNFCLKRGFKISVAVSRSFGK